MENLKVLLLGFLKGRMLGGWWDNLKEIGSVSWKAIWKGKCLDDRTGCL